MFVAFVIVVAGLAGSVALGGCRGRGGRDAGTPAPVRATPATESSFTEAAPTFDPTARYLLIGGGGEPDSSEVQLEADVGLAHEVLAGPGSVLFAGGAGRFGVRELDARASNGAGEGQGGARAESGADGNAVRDPDPDAFRAELGMMFLPRARASRVRAPRIHVDGAATYENVTRALDAMLAQADGPPLLVLLAAHGERASDPLDGYAVLWGNDGLFVRDVIDVLAAPTTQRASRWIVASCFGGAFARLGDVVGPNGRERVGTTSSPEALHCGVYATEATRLASGCDADPERARHEGYSKLVFGLLGGRVSAAAGHDLDADGRLSLLEAHTAATVLARSFDVPVSSSEEYARASVAALSLPWEAEAPESMPETDAIIRQLSASLHLENEPAARAAAAGLDQSLAERDDELAELEAMRDGAWNRLRVALLERWPWLEDAYAPGWERRLQAEQRAIRAVLFDSDVAAGYREAEDRAGALAEQADALRVDEALVARLVRAHALARMVAVLRRLAPERFARFEALRACERFVPAVRATR